IHRDLKPGNVLMARGGIKVIDFGIARAFEATSQHTRTDQMVGTVSYMAPERFDPVGGRPVTAAADIFAWGAVVAYAATGRTPFAADSTAATAVRILTQSPDLTGLPASLRQPVERALAKEPEERPTARELLDMLLHGAPAGLVRSPGQPAVRPADEPTVPADDRPREPAKRRGVLVPALVAAVGVLIAGAAGLYIRDRSDHSGELSADVRSSASVPVPENSGDLPEGSDAPVSEPETPEERQAAIMRGTRKTLIHFAEIDRDLAFRQDFPLARAGDGTGAKSEFALQPTGVDYMIRSLADPDSEVCLGVKITTDNESGLTGTDCYVNKATLFHLSASGETDDNGRPTYYIYNDAYGFVQFHETKKTVYVEHTGDGWPLTSISFVDRGELPS
ncbi:serine/threonine protein kinase, partial [Actinoplanes rectilineatus]|uniref:serine/threonine protein kinase n=1 Tax=Actinoplanes rectilineatus TaxID=113571 RepID=UPI0005F2CA95